MESSFAGWCNYKTKSQIWSPFLTQSIYQPFHLTPSHSIHQPFHLTPNQLTLTSKSPPLTINESHIDPSQSPSTPWLTSLPHPTPGSASLFFDTLAHLTSHTTTCPTSLLLPWSISLPHATPYPPHCHSTRWPTSFSLSNLAHLTSTYHTLIRLTLLQRPKPLHSLSTPYGSHMMSDSSRCIRTQSSQSQLEVLTKKKLKDSCWGVIRWESSSTKPHHRWKASWWRADTLTAKKRKWIWAIHAEKYSRKFRENIKPIIFIYLEMCFVISEIF